jgi:hypothetical protein
MGQKLGPDESLAAGEHPETTSADEATRWVTIYTELLAFEKQTIDQLRQNMSHLSADARAEVERTNLPGFADDRERFQARLTFWKHRLTEVQANKTAP